MAEGPRLLTDARCRHLQWFSVRTGIDFLSVTATARVVLDPPPVDVSVHQSELHMGGFWSLKEALRSRLRAWNLSQSPTLVGRSALGMRGAQGRAEQRETGTTTLEVGDCRAGDAKLSPQPRKCHFCQTIS